MSSHLRWRVTLKRLDLLRPLERFPWPLLVVCLALLGVSLVVLHSASLTPEGQVLHYAGKQITWVAVGLVGFLGAAFVPYDLVGRRWPVLYLLGLLALAAVLVVGTDVNGSRRWFSLGPVRVQPSEVMKYVLVVCLAHVIARRGERIQTWGGLAEVGVLVGLPLGLVLIQPDLGTSLTYLPIVGVMVFVAGARLVHLGLLATAGLAACPLAWLFVLKPYQKGRILAFLDSGGDQALGGAYQTTQSMIAIGSGGALGRGYMQGTQGPLGFLPERHTDFVFAVICEDFGLLGALGVLALYGALLACLIRIARTTRDAQGRLLVLGVATITVVQITVNAGMALGVMPVTGLTLPLISYGGSSLAMTMTGFGLAASVARRRVLSF